MQGWEMVAETMGTDEGDAEGSQDTFVTLKFLGQDLIACTYPFPINGGGYHDAGSPLMLFAGHEDVFLGDKFCARVKAPIFVEVDGPSNPCKYSDLFED